MSEPNAYLYPLGQKPTRKQLRRLCQVLWQWKLCEDCSADKDCSGAFTCPWQQKSSRMEPFFQYYHKVTKWFTPEHPTGDGAALRSHDDLIVVVAALRGGPQTPRGARTASHFAETMKKRGVNSLPPVRDQNRAFSLAACVLAMVNSSAENQVDGLLEPGRLTLTWQGERSFSEFMETAFPMQCDVEEASEDSGRRLVRAVTYKWPKLTARRLKKKAGLEFVATDNLQNHLRMDLKSKKVEIYHYTSVLTENLLSSVNCDSHDDTARGISEGNMPRELALETLLTIKEVLFPLDADSQHLLRTLVNKHSFDPDNLRFDTGAWRRADEKRIAYRYWGARLADLQEQMEAPTPKGFLERWMERRSGARYVMMATLAGVVLAVVLGALSLAVSVFQAWVGYQQWQHPVNPS